MRLIRYQSPFVGFENEINRLFGQASEGRRFPIEFHEDGDNKYVRVELPGVKREEVSVEIVEGELKVSAERKPTGQAQGGPEGENAGGFSYSRTIQLPEDVETEKVAASYENGLLTVTLPKREVAKPRRIELN